MEPQGCSPGGEGAGGLSRTALSPVKQLPLWGLWASSPPTVCLCDSCPPFDLRWAKPARGGGSSVMSRSRRWVLVTKQNRGMGVWGQSCP